MRPCTAQYAHTYLNVRTDLSVQGQKVRIFILITLNNFKKLRLLRILSLDVSTQCTKQDDAMKRLVWQTVITCYITMVNFNVRKLICAELP